VRISVYLPLLLSVALALLSPLTGRRLSPAAATRTLVSSAAVASLASTWALLLLSLTLLSRAPFAVEREAADPVPLPVAVLALLLLASGTTRAGRALRVRRQTEQAMRQVCLLCHPDGELAVVRDPQPQAYAVPDGAGGRSGRILVSTGLLQTATAADRRVVLAHERAHLRHAHHRVRAAAELAAAVNPLLIPLRHATSYLVERWADEDAAAATGSRTGAGAALARVALATGPSPAATGGALAFHRHAVPARVHALHSAPVRSRPALAGTCLLAVAVSGAATCDATLAFGRLLAQALAQ
jgi:Zn-dependent protease with chaperone function